MYLRNIIATVQVISVMLGLWCIASPAIAQISEFKSFSIADVADDLTSAANYISTRAKFAPDRDVQVSENERHIIETEYWSATELHLGPGAVLEIAPEAVGENGEFFVVVGKLATPETGARPRLVWTPPTPSPPPADQGRAESGAAGKAHGQHGSVGQPGRSGLPGLPGRPAPALVLIVLDIEGQGLQIDLIGSAGGPGGFGQAGGHGGAGAQGAPAQNAIRSAFGIKTAVGCAAGPGRGGNGGNGGTGGAGGVGGVGGDGGRIRIIAPEDAHEKLLKKLSTDIAGGAGGLGGRGGEAGNAGAGGPEGSRTSWCGSAGRGGANGSAGSAGAPGGAGAGGASGTIYLAPLKASVIESAFALEVTP